MTMLLGLRIAKFGIGLSHVVEAFPSSFSDHPSLLMSSSDKNSYVFSSTFSSICSKILRTLFTKRSCRVGTKTDSETKRVP